MVEFENCSVLFHRRGFVTDILLFCSIKTDFYQFTKNRIVILAKYTAYGAATVLLGQQCTKSRVFSSFFFVFTSGSFDGNIRRVGFGVLSKYSWLIECFIEQKLQTQLFKLNLKF